MAFDFTKNEEPDDSVFPVKFDDSSDLDLYGVWVKKRSEEDTKHEETKHEIQKGLKIEGFIEPKDGGGQNNKESFTEIDLRSTISENGITKNTLPDIEKSALPNAEKSSFHDTEKIAAENGDAEKNAKNGVYKASSDDSDSIIEESFDDAAFNKSEDFFLKEETFPETEEEEMPDLPEFQMITENTHTQHEDKENFMDSTNEFELLDLDDFFINDKGDDARSAESEKNGTGFTEPIKLDLSFNDTPQQNVKSSLPDTDEEKPKVHEAEYTSEFDELLKSLDAEPLLQRSSETLTETSISTEEENHNLFESKSGFIAENKNDDLDLHIELDEDDTLSSIAERNFNNPEAEEETIPIFDEPPAEQSSVASTDEMPDSIINDNDTEGLVIESTIIEADNKEAIKEENLKILNESASPKTKAEHDGLSDLDAMLDDIMDTNSESSAEIPESVSGLIDDTANFILEEPLEPQPSDSTEKSPGIDFDDVGALRDELFSDTESTAEKTPEIEPSKPEITVQNDKSTELLMQITSEFSSLKNEIAALKAEMADLETKLRSELRAEVLNREPLEEKDALKKEQSGFFGDDDADETIALTGDELNNILITADFSEENAEQTCTAPESLDTSLPEDENISAEGKPQVSENKDSFDFTVPEVQNIPEASELDAFTEDFEYDFDKNIFSPEEAHEDSIEDFGLDTSFSETVSGSMPEKQTVSIEGMENALSELHTDGKNILNENRIDTSITESLDLSDPSFEDAFQEELRETESFLPDTDDMSFAGAPGKALTETGYLDDPYAFPPLEDTAASKEVSPDTVLSETEDGFEAEKTNSYETPFFNTENISAASKEPSKDFEQTPANTATGDTTNGLKKDDSEHISTDTMPIRLKNEIKSVLSYMDRLLESLPEEKIEEFAKSEYFETYKRLFEELGIS